MAEETQTFSHPTYLGVVCPHCQSENWEVTGQKGGIGRSMTGVMFGAVGNIVRGTADELTARPLNAKCHDCKLKFEVSPLEASDAELLSKPATLQITRKKWFAGMAVKNFVMINGLMVAPIKNGQTITIEVSTAHVYLQLFDQNGVGSKVYERLPIQPGETVERSMRIKGRF